MVDFYTLIFHKGGIHRAQTQRFKEQKEAGETTLNYAVEFGVNYTPSPPVTGSQAVTITPAALTVTDKPKSVVYGNAPVNTGVTCSGFVIGETEDVLNGTLEYIYNYTQYGDKEYCRDAAKKCSDLRITQERVEIVKLNE